MYCLCCTLHLRDCLYNWDASSFSGGIYRAHVTDYFIGVDQKSPDWLILFTERMKMYLDPVLSLHLVSEAFSASDAILGLWFPL